ncbi:MAG: di-trans,poly-cis-decaprenylcistransferase [Clostridiales bacterium]|nr:di-trans,poly-cis-decaprenylcistransferase [Clostridiales bacterium]
MSAGTAVPKVPVHIAIIMDGNGRWAKRRALPRTLGHREGAETLKRITRYCKDIGVQYLTVYAFSTENWRRSRDEVTGIIQLLRYYIGTFDTDPERGSIRFRFVGNLEALDAGLRADFAAITEKTRGNRDAITLTIAFNYGGRDEILRAAKKAAELAARGELDPGALDETVFSGMLDMGGIPDPDLLIRSGSERRISNFLLWELAYAELWFTDVLWPDFKGGDIDLAIADYQKRQRRFGAVVEEGE